VCGAFFFLKERI